MADAEWRYGETRIQAAVRAAQVYDDSVTVLDPGTPGRGQYTVVLNPAAVLYAYSNQATDGVSTDTSKWGAERFDYGWMAIGAFANSPLVDIENPLWYGTVYQYFDGGASDADGDRISFAFFTAEETTELYLQRVNEGVLGSGQANTDVDIDGTLIGTFTATTAARGVVYDTFTFPDPLAPGDHQITFTANGTSGTSYWVEPGKMEFRGAVVAPVDPAIDTVQEAIEALVAKVTPTPTVIIDSAEISNQIGAFRGAGNHSNPGGYMVPRLPFFDSDQDWVTWDWFPVTSDGTRLIRFLQAWYAPGGNVDHWISFPRFFQRGTYDIEVVYIKSAVAGKFSVSFDGVVLGPPIDSYKSGASTFDNWVTYADIEVPASGMYEPKLEVVGKNGSSSGKFLIWQGIICTKTG